MAVVYAVVFLVSLWSVPYDTTERKQLGWFELRELDITGVALSVLGLGFLCSGLT